MTVKARLSWLALAAVLAGPVAAGAQDPCAAETARWCDAKNPSDMLSCLQSHRADLSDACRDYVEFAFMTVQVLIQDCTSDAFDLCRDAGRGRPMLDCLSANQGKLTPRCQQDFDAMARTERAAAKDCAADIARDCPKVQSGKGNVTICLLYHGRDLSPACRKVLTR